MIDKIFAVIISFVLIFMILLLAHGCFISVIAMHPSVNTNTWDSGYALLTTKAYFGDFNPRQPAKLHYGSVPPSSPSKEKYEEYQREHNAYSKEHNKNFPFRNMGHKVRD